METRTIKQVIAELPYLKATTIFTYMQRGLFKPVDYHEPPNGPGRSSRLNKVDVVAVGILSSLHNLGIRFGHLDAPDGISIPDTRFIIQNGQTEQLVLSDIGEGRRLQLELEATAYRSMIAVYKSRVVGFHNGQVMVGESLDPVRPIGMLTEIYMFTDKFLQRHLDAVTAVEPYDSVSFVNVKKMVNVVDRFMR